jgi:hypothetical protein
MPEIPEHLLRRSRERRKALGLPTGEEGEATEAAEAPAAETPETTAPAAEAPAPAGGEGGSGEGGGGEEQPASVGGIPAHLLERSRRRRAAAAGTASAPAAGTAPAAAAATAVAPPPAMTGPGGHTQRLLTVVKSGSIQQTRAEAQDKVHTWPHLLVVEFAATLAVSAVLFIFSAIVRAPLLSLADVNQTPNPSKAPWYFLGLQELLTMFHPMVAGVTIPGMGIFLLIVAPYIDRNPSPKPEDRKFAISLFTIFLLFWAVLVIIGSFFRGTGFNFVFPWNDGVFFEL